MAFFSRFEAWSLDMIGLCFLRIVAAVAERAMPTIKVTDFAKAPVLSWAKQQELLGIS